MSRATVVHSGLSACTTRSVVDVELVDDVGLAAVHVEGAGVHGECAAPPSTVPSSRRCRPR